MSEVKKIATRESYGNALVELGAEHDNLIVLDADLAAATKTGVFKKAYPDRHIDCGIAECNMMGIAAGLSTTGIVPFASTFAMFAQLHRISASECKNRCNPCRNLRRRRRCNPSVQRGYRPDENHSGHGHPEPSR